MQAMWQLVRGGRVALAAIALVACASKAPSGPRAEFFTSVQPVNPPSIARLLVLADLEPNPFAGISRGFEASLTNKLTMCGVASKILEADPLDRDPRGRLADAADQFVPAAMLSVTLTALPRITGPRGSWGTRQFVLKLVDARSGDVVWSASSTFQDDGKTDTVAGMDFAAAVVEQLREDGVLRRCPAVVRPRVDCWETWRRIVDRANRIEDREQRAQLMRAAPSCGPAEKPL
jgi:hypothetical protein